MLYALDGLTSYWMAGLSYTPLIPLHHALAETRALRLPYVSVLPEACWAPPTVSDSVNLGEV
jgi:hypothetical protein